MHDGATEVVSGCFPVPERRHLGTVHESTFISPSMSARTRGCNKPQNVSPPVRHVLAICGNRGQGQTNICIIT